MRGTKNANCGGDVMDLIKAKEQLERIFDRVSQDLCESDYVSMSKSVEDIAQASIETADELDRLNKLLDLYRLREVLRVQPGTHAMVRLKEVIDEIRAMEEAQ